MSQLHLKPHEITPSEPTYVVGQGTCVTEAYLIGHFGESGTGYRVVLLTYKTDELVSTRVAVITQLTMPSDEWADALTAHKWRTLRNVMHLAEKECTEAWEASKASAAQ